MRHNLLPIALLSACGLLQAQEAVPPPAAPKGEVLQFTLAGSTIYPGTTRNFWVYVPANYRPEKPACLYVHQDGIANDAPNVFDDLIASGAMPVTVGVFVQPGRVKAVSPNTNSRVNRSVEYDSLSPDYAKFLESELLPAVETKVASDGRPIRLSKNPDDRAIGGQSSGALAALNAAFQRPDLFHRVYSSVGSYSDIRGGDKFPSLIRKFEPKPLRVFLQDGSGDHNNAFGDWWMANQTLERALQFAGYEVEHAWGEGRHDSKESEAVFPDAMRFLWKDWPKPVPVPPGGAVLQKLIIPSEGWTLVSKEHEVLRGPATNTRGELFFNDVSNSKTYRLNANGEEETFVEESGKGGGQAFGPDGRLFAIAEGENKIVAYQPDGSMEVIAEGFHDGDLI
ncbi:MAG: gluconolactonase, partial [Verrucomicrobia bacterium]|nr:gluconolactonase [Verrucomicrobiota bacterium]